MRLKEFDTGDSSRKRMPGVFVIDPNPATRQSQIIQITNMRDEDQFKRMWNMSPESHHKLFNNEYPIWNQEHPLFSSLPVVKMNWGQYTALVNGFIIRRDLANNPQIIRLRNLTKN